jgi:hypothetical protein
VRVEIEDWKNGWFGIDIWVAPDEISQLISRLTMLERESDQHFHISSEYKGAGGVGDIQIAVLPKEGEHNMHLTSRVYAPGETIEKEDVIRP